MSLVITIISNENDGSMSESYLQHVILNFDQVYYQESVTFTIKYQ